MVTAMRRARTSARHVGDIVRSVREIRRARMTPGHSVRVLQLLETRGPGGAERMLADLAAALGPDCRATIGVRSGWLEKHAMAAAVSVETLGAHDDVALIAELLRVVRSRRIELIHAHEFYMSAIGAAISRLTGVPLVATIHGKSYYPERARRRLICRMMAAQAARVVTVSQDLRRFFCQETGVPSERVDVIYNGIDCIPLAASTPAPEFLEALGIPRNARIVGAVGNLYAVKGHVHLIRSLPAIVGRHPTTHLVILGRGAARDVLLDEAGALGVADRVHLVGYCDDVARWLRTMHVFASSSLSEGLPLSLLEAMAARTPVVVTRVGGMPEVVTDGTTGFLVPAADPEALADRICRLLSDAVLADALAAAGWRRVRERFSLDRMVGEYRDLYMTTRRPSPVR
jgi:glycosyltransferase involved in cell wall biosynthesis